MTLPENLTYVTVQGSVNVPAESTAMVIFKTPGWLVGNPFVPRFGIAAVIEPDGSFDVQLPATDDPAWNPVDWTYAVEIRVGSSVLTGSLAVPYDTIGTIQLDAALDLDQPADAGQVSYLLSSARGAVGGVAALDTDGDVVDAEGNKITATLAPLASPTFTGTPAGPTPSAGVNTTQLATTAYVMNLVASNSNRVTSGEELMDRDMTFSEVGLETGVMLVSYFTARKTETINNVVTSLLNNVGASNTTARIGIYSTDAAGGLTALLASTANDTALWTTSGANKVKALSSAFNKVAGVRYAVGFLCIGGTMPQLLGIFPATNFSALAPRANGAVYGQSALPASVVSGGISNDYRKVQAILTP